MSEVQEPTGPPVRGTRSVLLAQLDAIELLPRSDRRSARTRARWLLSQAEELRDPALIWRTRLVIADCEAWDRDPSGSAKTARAALRWAETQGDDHLRARAHRLIALLLQLTNEHGDNPVAIAHAQQAVVRLPANAPAAVRHDHLMNLGIALAVAEHNAEAWAPFQESLRLAEALDDPEPLLMSLNNLTYHHRKLGDLDGAFGHARRMRSIAAALGRPLEPIFLGTIGGLEQAAGDVAAAERTLIEAVESGRSDTGVIPDRVGESCVMLARLCRTEGRLDDAAYWLDRAEARLAEQGQVDSNLLAMEERAEQLAATGRSAEALAAFRAFHAAHVATQSASAAVHGKLLSAIFETDKARAETERLQDLAFTDPLTHIGNRRAIEVSAAALLGASSGRTDVGLALIDLDGFKGVNDGVSYQMGDAVLQRIAAELAKAAEAWTETTVGRLGGDEFVVLMPGVERERCLTFAEDLLARLHAVDFQAMGCFPHIGATIGLAFGRHDLEGLLRAADGALKTGKRNGRGQVVVASRAARGPARGQAPAWLSR